MGSANHDDDNDDSASCFGFIYGVWNGGRLRRTLSDIYKYTLVGAEYCSFRVSALLLFEPKPICALPFPEWFNFQGSSFLHTTPELNERLVALGTGMQEEINILGMKNAKF